MRRGDLVTVTLQAYLGNPRPSLVIQFDLFDVQPIFDQNNQIDQIERFD
jgi:hypothetical protein